MKKLLFAIFILSIFSCSKKETTQPPQFNNLTLGEIKSFVPYELLDNHTNAIYIDASGNNKVINIEKNSILEDKFINDADYTSETDIFTLTDADDDKYAINVTVSGQYFESGEFIEFVDCTILTSTNNGYIAALFIDVLGNYQEFYTFQNEVLNGISFENVYSNLVPDIQELAYSKVYYNTEFGVVGFLDKSNNLWALSHFE